MNTKTAVVVPAERWFETLIGLLPFLFWPLMLLVGLALNLLFQIAPAMMTGFESSAPLLVGLFFLLCLILLIGVVTAGGLLGWPSWVFPNAGVLVIISLLIRTLGLGSGTIFGIAYGGDDAWDWLAWIPEAVVVIILLVTARSFKPFVRLGQVLRRDWTRLSFAAYAVLPVAVVAVFDNGQTEMAVIAVLFLLITLGAWGYLRTPQVPWRFIWLAAMFWLAWAIGAVYTFFYWRGRQAEWMEGPTNGWPELTSFLSTGGQILFILCLPGLVYAGVYWAGRGMRGELRRTGKIPSPPPV
jgi:hypothetical protein